MLLSVNYFTFLDFYRATNLGRLLEKIYRTTTGDILKNLGSLHWTLKKHGKKIKKKRKSDGGREDTCENSPIERT